MSIRVAINGFGRIGRNVLRALYESSKNYDIKIVESSENRAVVKAIPKSLTTHDNTPSYVGIIEFNNNESYYRILICEGRFRFNISIPPTSKQCGADSVNIN